MSRNVCTLFFFFTTFVLFVEGLAAIKFEKSRELRRANSTGNLNKVCDFPKQQMIIFENKNIASPRDIETPEKHSLLCEIEDLNKKLKNEKVSTLLFKKKLEKKTTKHNTIINEKNEELDKKTKELIKLKSKLSSFKNIEREKKTVQDEFEELEKKYNQFLDEKEKLLNQNKTFQANITELSNKKKKLESENKINEKKINDLEDQLWDLYKEENLLKSKLDELTFQFEKSKLDLQLKDDDIKNKELQNNEQKILINHLKKELEKITEELRQLKKEETNEVLNISEIAKSDEKSIAELTRNDLFAVHTQEENALLKQQKIDLENQIKNLKSKIDSLHTTIENFPTKIKIQDNLIEDHKTQLAFFKNQIESLEVKKNNLEKELVDTQTSYRVTEEKNGRLIQELTSKIAELKRNDLFAVQTQEENALLKQQKIDWENEIKNLKSKIDSLHTTIENFSDKIKIKDNLIEEYKTQLDCFKNQIESLEVKKNNLEKELVDTRTSYRFTEEKNGRLIQELTSEIAELTRNDLFAVQTEEENALLKQQKIDFENEIKNLKSKIDSLHTTIENFSTKKIKAKEKIRNLESELKNLETQINQLQSNQNNNGGDDPEKNNSEITALKELFKNLPGENNNLEKELVDTQTSYRVTEEKNGTFTQELTSKKEEYEHSQNKFKALQNQSPVVQKEIYKDLVEIFPMKYKLAIGFLTLTTIIASLTAYFFYKKNKEHRANEAA